MALNKATAYSSVIVLYERSTDSLILTQRSEHLRSHPGEICFPGGLWETGDLSFYDTALRELQEELGISSDRVTLIRELKTQKTLLGIVIHPWLASIESLNPYCLNTQEVTRIITVPMTLVQAKKNYKEIIIERENYRFKSWEFSLNGDVIWGATARIMRQLIA